MFIDQDDLAGLVRGSAESFMASVLQKAESATGEEISVFATHQTEAYGVAGDRVVKLTWCKAGAGELSVKVEDAEVGVYRGEETDQFWAKELAEVRNALCGDGELTNITRNRLRVLAMRLDKSRSYWASDAFESVRSLPENRSSWSLAHRELGEAIAKAGIDRVVLAKKVPSTPYARIPSARLHLFAEELRQSVSELQTLLATVRSSVAEMVFDGRKARSFDAAEIASSMVEELDLWTSQSAVAIRMAKSRDLFGLAEFHDIFAGQLRAMLVMEQYLGSTTLKGPIQ